MTKLQAEDNNLMDNNHLTPILPAILGVVQDLRALLLAGREEVAEEEAVGEVDPLVLPLVVEVMPTVKFGRSSALGMQ